MKISKESVKEAVVVVETFGEIEFDETDEKAAARMRLFLDQYKELCRAYGCVIVADGEDVEVAPSQELANEDDPWGVEEVTRNRGWKI